MAHLRGQHGVELHLPFFRASSSPSRASKIIKISLEISRNRGITPIWDHFSGVFNIGGWHSLLMFLWKIASRPKAASRHTFGIEDVTALFRYGRYPTNSGIHELSKRKHPKDHEQIS